MDVKLLHRKKIRRARRVRAKIFGTSNRPRLAVFRSNKGFAVQLIDDAKGKTLFAASTKELSKEEQKKTKTEQAVFLGVLIVKKAKGGGITKAVLDRRSYRYHGRVRAFAESVRKGGFTI
ncbi:MAG: 50S ribosomal protein L18 [Patescibacteria group bacterium]